MPRTYYWHIHHDVIAEPTSDIGERKEYVRCNKPIQQVGIRLRLMVPVKDQDSVRRALEERNAIHDKAYEKYYAIHDKAWDEYKAIDDKAQEEYEATNYNAWKDYRAIVDKNLKDYNASLWELHKKEHPDCPWDGKTIFPGD